MQLCKEVVMGENVMFEAARAAGAPIEQAVALFMLHPETFAESIAAGYEQPFAGYVAGRGGVLGEATGSAIASVFVVFEPAFIANLWQKGVAVRGAAGAAEFYWEQAADFARKYLSGVQGLDRVAELGEKLIAVTPGAGLPLYAGWRAMPFAADVPARAFQVMFVLRELRGAVYFSALSLSGITPVEAHMLNKGHEYATMFGWPAPFADGAGKKDRYHEVERKTNQRMGEIFGSALEQTEAADLARLSLDVLTTLKANATD